MKHLGGLPRQKINPIPSKAGSTTDLRCYPVRTLLSAATGARTQFPFCSPFKRGVFPANPLSITPSSGPAGVTSALTQRSEDPMPHAALPQLRSGTPGRTQGPSYKLKDRAAPAEGGLVDPPPVTGCRGRRDTAPDPEPTAGGSEIPPEPRSQRLSSTGAAATASPNPRRSKDGGGSLGHVTDRAVLARPPPATALTSQLCPPPPLGASASGCGRVLLPSPRRLPGE